MKYLLHTIRTALAVILLASAVSTAGVYKLSNVKRIDKDLYKDTGSGVKIETRYCYHYTYGEKAILKWDGFSGKIIWADDSNCEVKSIFK